MKRLFFIYILATSLLTETKAQIFSQYFCNRTLRVDYSFCGDASKQSIYVDELSVLPTWAGRKHHLNTLPLEGNGQITLKDSASNECIYKTSFSSLFQEWLTTDEAKVCAKSFENTFLLPMPLKTAIAEVKLFDSKHKITTQFTHVIHPNDLLIHQKGSSHISPYKYLLKSGDSETCIDVAILAEGYQPKETEQFYADAQVACESLFEHEPFKSMKNRFNIIAVATPSADSGVSIPHKNEWRQTAFGSHFDTFYSKRYLTTCRVKSIHDALSGVPYEHIIILANTEQYGGGGIYNSYTLTTAHHPLFRPVVVHEFGHSFGGLADEYFYENDVMSDTYPLDVEPWEQNITTQTNFDSKWKDMLKKGTPNPTPVKLSHQYPIGVFQGGGYSAKGIYRPANNCRMRTNEHPVFCPVCQRALQRLIDFYTLP